MSLPIEHRWELRDGVLLYTAKWVQEIPPERAESLADTMAPVERLTTVLGCTVPWTLSAFTRRGRDRKIKRWERRHGFAGARAPSSKAGAAAGLQQQPLAGVDAGAPPAPSADSGERSPAPDLGGAP